MFAFLIPGASAQEPRIKHPGREENLSKKGASRSIETIGYLDGYSM
jgi:hypothetical protein